MLASFGSISLVFCFIAFVIFVFNALGKTFDSFVGTPRRKGRTYTHDDFIEFRKEYHPKHYDYERSKSEKDYNDNYFKAFNEAVALRKRQIENGERITPA